MNFVKAGGLVITFLCLATTGVRAAETGSAHPYLTEKFFLDLGIYFPDRKLRISVNGSDGVSNTDIDFDDELNLDASDQTAAINFGWRLGEQKPHHRHLLTEMASPAGVSGNRSNPAVYPSDLLIGMTP